MEGGWNVASIAIIDADLAERKRHRFPNLACMKLSSYYKKQGFNASLKLDYSELDKYDTVMISKVFTNTKVPGGVLSMKNVRCGGSGFNYNPPLPYEIEHVMPDYHLYDEWVRDRVSRGSKPSEFAFYTDYSIGFLTRGCFRQCGFCVNHNKTSCESHSGIYEFLDEGKPKLCFLDDNFFACEDWRKIISDVKKTNKRFCFKQGLDERLLTDEKIHEMVSWNYDKDFIFAFDDIKDAEIIEGKLRRIHELYPSFKKRIKFYVLCGYDRYGKYDLEFWESDIRSVFERCFILAKYSALPYLMRYERCYSSEFSGLYASLASWCNQPGLFKKFDFSTFCKCRGMNIQGYRKHKRCVDLYLNDGGKKGASWRCLEEFESMYPSISSQYFNTVPDSLICQMQ
jgi:hypothetical protein